MSKLPNGWVEVNIRDIAEYVQRGKSPRYTEKSALPVINQKCIRWFGVDQAYLKFIHPDQWSSWSPERFLQEGDLLWNSTGTGTIGRAALFSRIEGYEKFVVDSHVTIVRCNKKCFPHYLHYYIRSPLIQGRIAEMHTGSTNQVELSREEVLRTTLPLPPLNEQRRIVAKLDSLFSRSRRVREELERIPKLIKRYKQAVLAAACSGELTADWRREQGLKSIWQPTTLGELIIDKPKNGYSAKPVNYETPFRVLTLTATTSGKFNPEHFKYFDEIIEDESQFWLQPDDILVQRGNTIEYVGVPAIYDGSPKQFIFPDLMMRLRAKPVVLTRFLHMVLSCEKSRKYLRSKATGTAGNMPKINQSTLVSLPIDLPKFEEQEKIIIRVEKLFKQIDLIEQEYEKSIKLCDRLEQATLSKAFRGKLVPQNPEDEHASVLLERIRAELTEQGSKAKGAKKPTGKTTAQRSRKTKQQDSEPIQLGLPELNKEVERSKQNS